MPDPLRLVKAFVLAASFSGFIVFLAGCGPASQEDGPEAAAPPAEEKAMGETAAAAAPEKKEIAPAAPVAPEAESEAAAAGGADWLSWRGPLQNGLSLEEYGEWAFDEKPAWTWDVPGRGTPVIHDGRVYAIGYRIRSNEDVREYLVALDAQSGKVIWEKEFNDFISDTVYNRYAVGSPAVDADTGNVYLMLTNGLFSCFSRDGDLLWQYSLMERFGRLTFPNGRAGCPVIEGDLVIARGITTYWGKQGPARDRFLAFDKKSGELVWDSTPGVGPPFLKDSSFSTPVFETRAGKRVFYVGLGCGNVACVNALNGQPIWRYQAAKGGINVSPILHNGDKLIYLNDKVNVHSTTKGGMVALKLPMDLENPGGEIDEAQGGAPGLPRDTELWRNPELAMFTSSPVLMGDRVYQVTITGELFCVNPVTGETLWKEKLGPDQIHASPLGVDGLLFVPVHEGTMFVVKPSDQGAEILHKIDYNEDKDTDGAELCLGSPSVSNGRLYVHTTRRLYCYQMKIGGGITLKELPRQISPVAQAPAGLRAIPTDILLQPGDSQSFSLQTVDRNGVVTGSAESATWEKFIPPTAKVKSEMDADFDASGALVTREDSKISAGAFMGTAGELKGTIRGRILPVLPYEEDFESYELAVDHPADGVKFAYPPLAWIGARFKWEVRELEGNKVFAKTLDRILFQRALTFIGHPDLSNYTMQADVMTDGNRRIKSVVGFLHQRYNISLVGNKNILEVSSNFERLAESVPFPVAANQWYTLKTKVEVGEDGNGMIRAKAWVKGEPEPEAWTIEVPHENAHKVGAPGLFGFSPQSQKRVFVDNIKITSNE